MSEREERRGWHVGREIPVALLVTLVLQTGGFIWWMSKIDATVSAQGQAITEVKAKVETVAASTSAAAALPLVTQTRVDSIENQTKELRSTIEAMRSEWRRGYRDPIPR